jgi:hypothetical protein
VLLFVSVVHLEEVSVVMLLLELLNFDPTFFSFVIFTISLMNFHDFALVFQLLLDFLEVAAHSNKINRFADYNNLS